MTYKELRKKMQIITKFFDPIHQRLLLKRQQIKHFDLISDTVTHIALASSLLKHNTSLLFNCTSGTLPVISEVPSISSLSSNKGAEYPN
jgi:hypothetical protein